MRPRPTFPFEDLAESITLTQSDTPSLHDLLRSLGCT